MDIAAHRANPGVSLERHVKSRVVALGRLLDGRAAIYLDTKFWIVLRDCAAGRNSDPAAQELLARLRKLIWAGKAFCPISESAFSEFLKQEDTNSRLETAQVVDELSLGVTLLDHRMRLGTEISHFVHGVVAQPEFFPPGTLLGPFRGLCEQRVGTPNEILNQADIVELRHLTNYGNQFHHDSNAAHRTQPINDGELLDYARRTLAFARR